MNEEYFIHIVIHQTTIMQTRISLFLIRITGQKSTAINIVIYSKVFNIESFSWCKKMSIPDPLSRLKLPNGSPVLNTDKIMVQKMWANHINETHDIIIAGMGHPTFYIAKDICEVSIRMWKNVGEIIRTVTKEVSEKEGIEKNESRTQKDKIEEMEPQVKKEKSEQKEIIEKITAEKTVTDLKKEDREAIQKIESSIRPSQQKMANSLNAYYGLFNYEMQIRAHHIRFLAGGAGGLHIIFKLINLEPKNYILTQSPILYALYRPSQ